MTTALGTAIAFARREHAVLTLTWPIDVNGKLRCCCRRAVGCLSPAKHPYGRLAPNGLLSASTDEMTIRRWFADEPAANLGIRTDRLIVIDADPRHGGDATLAELEREQPFPKTWRSLTGGGGEHILFACPEGVTVNSSQASSNPVLGAGIDVRARGGYIVASPSRHISGRSYAWSVDHHPAETPLAVAPAWLLERLATHQADTAPLPRQPEEWLRLTREPVVEYQDFACARFAGYLVRHLDPVVAFDILFWWNDHVCRPPLEATEVHRIWQRIVRREAERVSEEARRA